MYNTTYWIYVWGCEVEGNILLYAGQTCRKEERHRHGTNAVKNHRWKIKSQHIDIIWDKEIPFEEAEVPRWSNYAHEDKVDKAERQAIATVERLAGMYGPLCVECGNGNKLGGKDIYNDAYEAGERWLIENYLDCMKEAWEDDKKNRLEWNKCVDDTIEEMEFRGHLYAEKDKRIHERLVNSHEFAC